MVQCFFFFWLKKKIRQTCYLAFKQGDSFIWGDTKNTLVGSSFSFLSLGFLIQNKTMIYRVGE